MTDYDEQWLRLDDFIRYNPGARHRRRICGQLLAPLHFASCLDAGCGNGALVRDLRALRPEARLTGIDVAASVVRRNAERFPDIRFAHLDIEQAHLDERFDLVVCSEVIEHLADRPRAMANLARMVGPGGHLLVTCPSGRVYPTERAFGHVSHPTLTELAALGAANGLTTVTALNWGWPVYTCTKAATNLDAERALAAFASGPYSAAQKALCAVLYAANFLNLTASRFGCQLFVLFANAPS